MRKLFVYSIFRDYLLAAVYNTIYNIVNFFFTDTDIIPI